jgi:DNA mismatch endonuclease (patch repair protein)
MVDKVSKEKRSEMMSRVKNKDTKLEILFRKELWKLGFRYSKNSTKYVGKPDLTLPKYKTVIFIDSCFWHGCKKHGSIPATNRDFWVTKLNRNKERDKEVSKFYKKQGWQVIRVWEHEFKEPGLMARVAKKIKSNL